VKHTKQYLREAIRRREIQGYEFTSVPILYNMVREFLLRGGELVPANLWMRIQKALYKGCPGSREFGGKDFWFAHNDRGEWGRYHDPNVAEIHDCFFQHDDP
jgi:hypothetical protein